MKDVLGREEIDRHILEWYRLSKGEAIDQSDSFFRFVAAWVAFNAFYSSRMYDEVGDWNQVRAYAGEPEVVDFHRDLLKSDREYAQAVEVLREKGVYDTSTRSHRQIRDARNFTQVASCLYQVRCNLFHGGKTPGNVRDRRLVSAAHIITSRLIEGALKMGSEQGGGGQPATRPESK
jgi:hypothetical protein